MSRKIIILTLFLVILRIYSVLSQVITVDPEFPTVNDSVIIYFDATQGNQALKDYTGDIYAHTGLITDQSTSSSNWRFVIAEWAEDTEKAKLIKISTNLYKFDIKPSIKEFYQVTEGDSVLQLAFVFRNSGGSLIGREEGGGDIFADVYPPGLNLNISSPTNDHIILSGEQVQINASSNDADSMFLYIDNTLIIKVEAANIDYAHTENNSGSHKIKILVKNTEESALDSVNFFVRGTINEASLPNGWIKGINYLSDDSVGLVLFAPNKEYVFVVGDFNDWQLREDYSMNKTPDGEYYWLAIGDLVPNKEYIFQYFIDSEIRIADPYTEKTSDINDQYILEETYPELIDYPEGKTTNIASVLQTGQSQYQWGTVDFNAPEKENLIIYELLVRDFLAKHDYKTLIDTLDYLDTLGVNAIELMPFSEFEGNESWGYNPSFYFAPDKYYGPKDNLKEFIDSCHSRGIAVIMDMVLNHSYGQSPLVRMYFDPNAGDYGQPTAENPWYNEQSPNTSYSWGSDFNHESVYTKEFVDSVNSFWLQNYKVDGFRFDFTKGFTNTPGDGGSYDASRISILKRMADKIWEANSSAYVILEHFAVNTEEKELSDYGMMIWGNINYQYREAVKGNNSDISWGSYKERAWNNPYLISYMESHDEERLMYECLSKGNSYGSYDITNLSTALKRMELAANFFIPIPGPKMIWQFGEIGYDISIDYDCRVCNKPILWDYIENEGRMRVYRVYQILNKLKQKYDLFSTSNFSINEDGKAKSINLYSDGLNAVIIGNFDVTTVYVNTNFPKTGTWYELYTGDSITISNTEQMISLSAGEYRFYTDAKINEPIFPVIVGDVDQIQKPDVLNVFPNPSSDIFYFKILDEYQGKYQLLIYDINGKVVDLNCQYNDGVIKFNASHIPDGIYIYKLISGDQTYSGKLLKH